MNRNADRDRSVRWLLTASLALSVLAALAGCVNDSIDPVFYALEKEQSLVDDRGLADNTTIHRIVKAGSRYFAAAGALYTRTDGAGEIWSTVAPPVSGALCNTLEVFDNDGAGPNPPLLYAGFYGVAGTPLGLYQGAPGATITWGAITDTDFGVNAQVTLIKAVDATTDEIFVATLSGGTYRLTRSTDGATFDPAGFTAAPATSLPVIDVAADGATRFWAVFGSELYRDIGGNSFSKLTTPSPTSAYGGVFYPSSGTLYLSSDNGVASSPDLGDNWTPLSAYTVDEKTVAFTHFTEVGSNIYVGTARYGFYLLAGGNVAAAVRQPDYTISALYNGAVLDLFYDGAKVNLFIGTAGAGLWRGDWDSVNSKWLWKQE